MPASLIGALRVALGLDTAAFDSGASQAEKRAEQLGQRIGEALRAPVGSAISLKNAIVALGSAATVKALFDLGKRALDYASSLDEVSQQLGVTSKDLQTYRYIASQVGISQEEMDKGLSKLTVTMGQARDGIQKPADAFRELSGILGKDILKSAGTAGDAIPLIADALAKIPDPTKRARLEIELFGKTGQKLDTMLSGGGDAINQLKQAAQDLGLVLSDSQIQNADAAADKLSELKQVMSADIASVVADNAKAIYTFADSIEHLIPLIIKFLNTNPQLVMGLLGAGVGLRFGGPIGGIVGGIGGELAGQKFKQFMSDSNMDPTYRLQQAQAARDKVLRLRANPFVQAGTANSGTLDDANRDLVKQNALLKQAQAAAKITTPGVTGFGASGGGQTPADRAAAAKAKSAAEKAAREAEQQRKKELADQRAYDADLGRTRSEYLSAQEALTPDIVEQASLQRQQLQIETDARIQSIETNEKYSRAQKDELEGYERKIAALKDDGIGRELIAKQQQQAFTSAQAANDNQSDILKAQEGLATTAKQRLKIELQLLDLSYQSQIAQQDYIIASKDSTKAQIADAEARKAALTQVYGLQRSATIRQNQGPLGDYINGIPKSADEMNEALQKVAVDGLGDLNDGLADAITGAKSLGDVFEDVSKQIIAALAKIAIQKAIIGPLANALGGLLGGTNLFGSTPAAGSLASFDALPGLDGAMASGGSVVGGKNYLVGERGPEIFSPDLSGRIISNDNLTGNHIEAHFHQSYQFEGVAITQDQFVSGLNATQQSTLAQIRELNRRSAGRG